jgi:hypothetical protein
MEETLTVSQLDADTIAWIRQESQRTGTPVEVIIRQLIYRGLEVERQKSRPQRFHDLDALAGTWSAEDAADFHRAIEDFQQIDTTLWQ